MWHALKQLLTDFLSALAYAVALAATRSIPIATAIAVGIAAVQFGSIYARGRVPTFMQWASLLLVLVLGSASLLLNDPRFVMLKPSIAHFAIAAVMFRRSWMRQYVPQQAIDRLGARIFERWGYAWAVFMIVLGIINLAVAARGDIALWGGVVIALGLAKLAFFAVQSISLRRMAARSGSSG